MMNIDLKKMLALAITCSMTFSVFFAAMPEKAAAVPRADKTSEQDEETSEKRMSLLKNRIKYPGKTMKFLKSSKTPTLRTTSLRQSMNQ